MRPPDWADVPPAPRSVRRPGHPLPPAVPPPPPTLPPPPGRRRPRRPSRRSEPPGRRSPGSAPSVDPNRIRTRHPAPQACPRPAAHRCAAGCGDGRRAGTPPTAVRRPSIAGTSSRPVAHQRSMAVIDGVAHVHTAVRCARRCPARERCAPDDGCDGSTAGEHVQAPVSFRGPIRPDSAPTRPHASRTPRGTRNLGVRSRRTPTHSRTPAMTRSNARPVGPDRGTTRLGAVRVLLLAYPLVGCPRGRHP